MSKPTINTPSGILLLDKPKGYSSNAALQTVRRLFNKVKAGHTGCLDPLATGMLPICLGEATKFSQYILEKDKIYVTEGHLGITTTTGDVEGAVLEECDASSCTKEALLAVLLKFLGSINQVPPMFSAVKVQGMPLYKLARKGQIMERAARHVVIHELVLQRFNLPYFQLFVRCSKGTYIRSLVEEIGYALGVGAHVSELRRLATAGFENDTMLSLEELERMGESERQTKVLPITRTVENLPRLVVSNDDMGELFQGRQVSVDEFLVGLFSLSDSAGKFLGVGECLNGMLRVKRLIASPIRRCATRKDDD